MFIRSTLAQIPGGRGAMHPERAPSSKIDIALTSAKRSLALAAKVILN